MAIQTVQTAVLTCSFGAAPSTLTVTSQQTVLACSLLAATIGDNTPPPPFGLCASLSNPAVASATAAALGVLTPQPCTPVTPAPWVPGSPTVLIEGKPALNHTSKLTCAFAGVIQIQAPVAMTVQIP